MKRLLILFVLGVLLLPRTASAQFCVGDCSADGRVSIAELIILVDIALGTSDPSRCYEIQDTSIHVLIRAVKNALDGCPPESTPTELVGTPPAETETPASTTTPLPPDTLTPTEEATASASPTQTEDATETPASTETATVESTPSPTGEPALFQGALVPSTGRFTYQATVGIDGADAECDVQFPGSHACTVDQLRAAEAAGELAGARDTDGASVTSFWAIDPERPDVDQCHTNVPWDYATAHTGHFADVVNLDNGAGTLSALQEDQICAVQHWVGCCL